MYMFLIYVYVCIYLYIYMCVCVCVFLLSIVDLHDWFQVCNIMIQHFLKIYHISSYYKILAVFPVLYNISL